MSDSKEIEQYARRIYELEARLEKFCAMAYRLARSVRESNEDMDLLGELRALDPKRYDKEVGKWKK